jgi:hypothetical protein
VFAGPDRLGSTPMEVDLPPGGRAEYRFERRGFRPRSLQVAAEAGVVQVSLARATSRRDLGERPRNVEDRQRGGDPLKPDPFQ